jgi:hypothetical protein
LGIIAQLQLKLMTQHPGGFDTLRGSSRLRAKSIHRRAHLGRRPGSGSSPSLPRVDFPPLQQVAWAQVGESLLRALRSPLPNKDARLSDPYSDWGDGTAQARPERLQRALHLTALHETHRRPDLGLDPVGPAAQDEMIHRRRLVRVCAQTARSTLEYR